MRSCTESGSTASPKSEGLCKSTGAVDRAADAMLAAARERAGYVATAEGAWLVLSQVSLLDLARAATEALASALEPFSDIDGEGDEDYPDETSVTVSFGRTKDYTLRLGDLRRAREACRD